jgi:hypothetical protein
MVEEALASTAGGQAAQDGDRTRMVDAQLGAILSPWFRFFLSYDPRPALSRLACPVLAINGEKDLQVPPAENLAAIEEALREGRNPDCTVKQLSGLNHLFQTCRTGAVAEYVQIEETMSPAALDEITEWITKRMVARR